MLAGFKWVRVRVIFLNSDMLTPPCSRSAIPPIRPACLVVLSADASPRKSSYTMRLVNAQCRNLAAAMLPYWAIVAFWRGLYGTTYDLLV